MKNIITLLILITSLSLTSQTNYKEAFSKVNENIDKNRLDSIAKKMGFKGGESFRVFTKFSVNWKGEIVDISARGTHKIFEEEAIRLVKMLPKIKTPINLKEGEKMKFTLPINLVLETESEKKRRLRKEKGLKNKLNKN